jgi:hypothetical protein
MPDTEIVTNQQLWSIQKDNHAGIGKFGNSESAPSKKSPDCKPKSDKPLQTRCTGFSHAVRQNPPSNKNKVKLLNFRIEKKNTTTKAHNPECMGPQLEIGVDGMELYLDVVWSIVPN